MIYVPQHIVIHVWFVLKTKKRLAEQPRKKRMFATVCLSVLICLSTYIRKIGNSFGKHACFPPFKSRTNRAGYFHNSKQKTWWILAGISSKSIVMLFGMECSWNICCPRLDQQVLQSGTVSWEHRARWEQGKARCSRAMFICGGNPLY